MNEQVELQPRPRAKDQYINDESQLVLTMNMVALGMALVNKRKDTKQPVPTESLEDEIRKSITEPHLGAFSMENVLKVISMAARTGELGAEHMEHLASPFVLSTREGLFLQNSNPEGFKISCEFLTKMVKANTPIDGIQRLPELKERKENLRIRLLGLARKLNPKKSIEKP